MAPWLVLGGINAVVVALRPLHYVSTQARVVQIFYDLGHHASLACLAYSFALVGDWLPQQRRIWTRVTFVLVMAAIGCHSLMPDLVGLGERLAGQQIRWVPYLLAAIGALCVPAAFVLGQWLAHRGWRLAALPLAALLVGFNFRFLRGSHPGIHTFAALSAAALTSAALHGIELPMRWRGAARRARFAVPVLATGGAITIFRAPSAEVQLALARVDTALLSPVTDILWKRDDLPVASVPEALARWFERRTPGSLMGPTSGRPIAPNPVVVLVTIDAVRGDLILDERNSDRLPSLTTLRNESVFFPQARSTAPDTRTSLAAVFTGKLFSGLPWTKLYSSIETYTGPYFPEILTRNGVVTINFAADYEIASQKRGVVRGFSEERTMRPSAGAKLPLARDVVAAVIARLRETPERAMFFYTHLEDPHAPYDLGGKGKDDRDSYLKEVETVGKALMDLRAALEATEFAGRAVLIVSADHGEFFGEHGYYHHGRTLYDEVVRVPLLIKASGMGPRRVSDAVSLLDLGPTILDLFGMAWPSDFMGETLRPMLTGAPAPRNRPIPLQSRINYGLVFPDGYKAMVNWSRNWEEVYHLGTDPGERLNLRDRDPSLADQRIALLRRYFNTHVTAKANGEPF
jgi:hypothetical protein